MNWQRFIILYGIHSVTIVGNNIMPSHQAIWSTCARCGLGLLGSKRSTKVLRRRFIEDRISNFLKIFWKNTAWNTKERWKSLRGNPRKYLPKCKWKI